MIVRLQGRGRDVLTKVCFSRRVVTVVVHLPPSSRDRCPSSCFNLFFFRCSCKSTRENAWSARECENTTCSEKKSTPRPHELRIFAFKKTVHYQLVLAVL
jgi:hypothetical protein